MTVVLVPIVLRDGPASVFVISIFAGLMIIACALFRLGRYLEFIPWPVFEGFTLGIAIIIFLQQVPNALGVPKPDGERTAVVAAKAVGDALRQWQHRRHHARAARHRHHDRGASPQTEPA